MPAGSEVHTLARSVTNPLLSVLLIMRTAHGRPGLALQDAAGALASGP